MEAFISELRQIHKIHSGECHSKTSEQHNSNEHHKRSEIESLSVEVKVDVEQEFRVEGKPADTTEKGNDPPRSRDTSCAKKSPNRKKAMCSTNDSLLDVVSTLRHSFSDDSVEHLHTSERKRSRTRYYRDSHSIRSRSRSCSGTRCYKKSDRYRRSSSKNGEGGRRSRSRSRYRHGCYNGREDRRSRSPSRRRRGYSSDRDNERRSRSRKRRATPDRRRTRYSGRSRSRSKNRRDDTRRSRRSYSSESSSSQSRNGHREDVQDKPACSSYDSPKMCGTLDATDHNDTDHNVTDHNVTDHSVTDQKPVQNNFDSRATIEILRSRIKSTLMNSGAKWNDSESRNEETIQSRGGISIDYNIFNSIVSTATSTVTRHSNSNIDNGGMQFNTTDQRNTNIQSSQFPDAPSVNMNYQSLFDQIKDPRIRKMILTSPTTPDQHSPHQLKNETVGYRGSVHGTNDTKSAPLTYGEYKRQQSRGTASTTDKVAVSKLIPTAEVSLQADEIMTRKEATKKHAVILEKRKTSETIKPVTLPEHLAVVPKPVDKAIRKKATKQAAIQQKGKPNKNKRDKKQDVSNTSDEGNGTSLNQISNHISALKELVNPQNLLTLMDLMEQMTENNSLAEVKEALKETSTNQEVTTAIEKDIQPNQKQLVSTGSTLAGHPKQATKRKNELDRLHEDIDNMFIRDGVLNASGRQRASANSGTNIKSSVNDAVDVKPKIKSRQRAPSGGPVAVICKEEIPEAIPAIPSPSQVSDSAVKMNKQNSATGTKTVDIKTMSLDHLNAIILLERMVPQKPTIKNNNPDWHSLKKILLCQICDNPPGVSLISHYVNFHPNAEVLSSRLSPEAAQYLRSSTYAHPLEIIRSESGLVLKQFCYFCNTNCTYSKACWIDHMIRHTGYFHYRCNCCLHKFSSKAAYHACKKGNGVIERFKQPIFQQENILAYVCELCNYVRLNEDEIKMHLNNEHEVGDMMKYGEFLFLVLPKQKIGRPRKQKPDIFEEFENGGGYGDLFDEEYDSKIRCALQSE